MLMAAVLACGLALGLPRGAAWAAESEIPSESVPNTCELVSQEALTQDDGSGSEVLNEQLEGADSGTLPLQTDGETKPEAQDIQQVTQPEVQGATDDILAPDPVGIGTPSCDENPTVENGASDALASEVEDTADESGSSSIETPVAVGESTPEESAPSSLATPVAAADGGSSAEDGLPATPAKAVTLDEGKYVFQSEVTANRVIKAKKTKSGSGLVTATYKAGKAQQWTLVREGNSLWYRILSAENEKLALVVSTDKSGKRVVKLASAKATTKGSLLRMLWSFVDVGKGARQMVNASCPDLRLGVEKAGKKAGTKVAMLAAKAASAKSQRMKALNANPAVRAGSTIDDGSYVLRLSGSALVAEGDRKGITKKSAVARLAASSSGQNQRMYLERTKDGYYIAWVQGTGKVLSAASSSILSGSKVRQRAYSGGNRQKWALTTVRAKDGSVYYRLQNKATGLYLGAMSGKEGTSLAGKAAGETYSSFGLESTSLLDKGIYALAPQSSAKVSVQVRKQSTGTAGLVLWTSNDSLGQRFELVQSEGENLWRIRTGSSGGWLTWTGGDKVVQKGYGKTAASASNTWHAVWTKGGISLVNVACEQAGKPLALSTDQGKSTKGTALVLQPSKGVKSQHFMFEPTQLLSEGYYFLRNGGSKFLKVKDSSLKNGASMQVASKAGSASELFQVEYKGANVRIKNVYSGKYLQISENASGASVTQRKENSSKKQLWKCAIVDGGYVQIRSAANSSLVLDAAKSGSKAGAAVRVTAIGADNGQNWQPVTLSSAVNATKTAKQRAVVRSCKRTPSPGGGLCAAWVSSVIANAGIGSWNGDACDLYRRWCKSTDLTKLRPGMIVAVSTHGHTSAGKIWGHVGVYIGKGTIMDNIGFIRTMSVFDWIAWYGDRVQPKWGWLGGAKLR